MFVSSRSHLQISDNMNDVSIKFYHCIGLGGWQCKCATGGVSCRMKD